LTLLKITTAVLQ